MNVRAISLGLGLVLVWNAAPLVSGQENPQASKPPAASAQQPPGAPKQDAAPRLELSSEEWDFGSLWYGEPCSTEITIRNAGDAPLKILKVKTSCGCTVASPKRNELGPGESDTMTLSYNTKKKKRHVSQTVTLETNDPQRPRVAIQVKGEVKEVYEATPDSRITFTAIDRNATTTQSIELHNNMEQKVALKLQPITEPIPFEIKLEPIEEGMVYKLSATTKPPLKVGANSADIVLETGLTQLPSLTIPVSAYIAPRVVVRPPRLYVSPKLTRSFQQTVSVDYQPDKPIQITEIKSSLPDLIKAELLPPGRQNAGVLQHSHRIRVTLPPGDQLPKGGAKLEIYTDDPSPEYHKLVVDIELRRPVARPLPRAKAHPAAGEHPAQPEDNVEGEANVPE